MKLSSLIQSSRLVSQLRSEDRMNGTTAIDYSGTGFADRPPDFDNMVVLDQHEI